MAVAIKGPISGTAVRRRITSFSLARWTISASSLQISISRWVKAPTRTFNMAMVFAGKPLSGSSTLGICRAALLRVMARFTRTRTHRVDRVCALHDQKISNPEDHHNTFATLTVHGHEPYRLMLIGLATRLGTGCVVLLPLDQRVDLGGGLQPHLITSSAISRPQKWALPQAY